MSQNPQNILLFQELKGKGNIWTPQQVKVKGVFLSGYIQTMTAILKAAILDQGNYFSNVS